MIRPRDFDDTASPDDPARARACEEFLERLELAWSEGQLADTLVALAEDAEDARDDLSSPEPSSPHEPRALAAHLGSCSTCSREARSLENLDHLLRREIDELAESVSPPPEDEILALLREPIGDPVTENLRRVSHRSLRTIVWITFLLLSLLFASSVGALIYFGYRLAAE